jgi:cytoskeletal protein CcmA (bactofilin family)
MVFKAKPVKVEKVDSQNLAMTFISKGSEVKGDIFVAGNLRVDGAIQGSVRAGAGQLAGLRHVGDGNVASRQGIHGHPGPG